MTILEVQTGAVKPVLVEPLRAGELTAKELAESFVFPAERTSEEMKSDSEAIQKLRRDSSVNQNDEVALTLQLLQLKYRIEDYVQKNTYDEKLTFSHFLKEYVLLANKKQKAFAQEIDMKPTELSQILNNHRKPPYGFVIRLEIHSNKTISALSWNRLIEKENEYELIHDKNIWLEESKHVKSTIRLQA